MPLNNWKEDCYKLVGWNFLPHLIIFVRWEIVIGTGNPWFKEFRIFEILKNKIIWGTYHWGVEFLINLRNFQGFRGFLKIP